MQWGWRPFCESGKTHAPRYMRDVNTSRPIERKGEPGMSGWPGALRRMKEGERACGKRVMRASTSACLCSCACATPCLCRTRAWAGISKSPLCIYRKNPFATTSTVPEPIPPPSPLLHTYVYSFLSLYINSLLFLPSKPSFLFFPPPPKKTHPY